MPKTISFAPRELLAANIAKLMAVTMGKDTPEKLAKFCRWPVGNKKAGKKIAPRTIRYMLDTRADAPAPSIDLIFAVAAALDRQPWELLADDEQTRRYLVSRLLHSEPVPDSKIPEDFRAKSKAR